MTLKSKLKRVEASWYVWLFPLFALLLSAWLFHDYYSQRGERIQILLEDAGSLQAEKSTVRFRGVAIGTVQDVRIAEDEKAVVAEVLLRRDADGFAVEGSKFTLVKPRVTLQGVSGLDTLTEGSYIAVLPGPPDGKRKTEFRAQSAGSTDPLDDTSAYLIETEDVESISPGSAVTYRGLKVGSVTKFHLAKGAQRINIQVNVENRYAYLVRANTVFWRKVGIQAKLGLFGSDIKVNSLDSIMNGGLQFATPDPAGPMAKALARFTLAPAAPKDVGKWKPTLE